MNGPFTIQASYCARTFALNGLLMHLSRGCKTGVSPPGITATSTFLLERRSFTASVKWPRKESHTRSARCSGVKRRFFRIHSIVPTNLKKDTLIRLKNQGCELCTCKQNMPNLYVTYIRQPDRQRVKVTNAEKVSYVVYS